MDSLQELDITCPYCWEVFSIVIEFEPGGMEFIEDCQICCHPIQFHIRGNHEAELTVHAEKA